MQHWRKNTKPRFDIFYYDFHNFTKNENDLMVDTHIQLSKGSADNKEKPDRKKDFISQAITAQTRRLIFGRVGIRYLGYNIDQK